MIKLLLILLFVPLVSYGQTKKVVGTEIYILGLVIALVLIVDYVIRNKKKSLPADESEKIEENQSLAKRKLPSKNKYIISGLIIVALVILLIGNWTKTTEKINNFIVSNDYAFTASQYNARGYFKIGLKDYNGAIADLNKAIELDPDYSNAYLHRGYIKSDLKDYYGAIADYTKAIELNPVYSAYFNRGSVKNDLKDYYGAMADYTKAIELDPNNIKAYVQRGNVKNDLKDYYGAMADYTKAIELDPDSLLAYVNRGMLKEDLGDLNGACADYRKASSLGFSDASKWVREQCN